MPHKKSNSLCGTLINDNDLIGNRSAYIESFLKNVFVNVNNPNFTSQAITFWINHWDAYFHVHSNQFSVEANNMATHQFMWNEWVAWLCKLNRFETLNEQIFSLWDAEWQTRMEPFISHQINCSQETCPEMYQNLLPLWRTNEELMITAWEGLGFTNNYNLRRNTYVKGSRHYELSNHLGNVLTVVSDRKIEHDERYAFAQGGGYKYENGAYHLDAAGSFAQLSASDGIISHYTAELISATDYYAFGAPLPERSWQGGEYRYGFNGQERDDEVAGAGNSYTAEYWQYDPRLGRRFNIDPKPNPSISNFACFNNSPISITDHKGDTTSYFDNIGNFLGKTNDNLENQIHFMGSKDQYDKILNANNGKSEKDKAIALRSQSLVFYDSETEAEMQTAYESSPDYEVGFGLVLKHAGSKELTFALCKTCVSYSKKDMEAKRNLNPESRGEYGVDLSTAMKELSKNAFAVFLIGHSHNKNASNPIPQNPSKPGYTESVGWGMKPVFNVVSDHQVDYQMYSSTPHPLMIISKYGITIYKGLTAGEKLPPDEYGTHPKYDYGNSYKWGNHTVRKNHY